MSLRGLTEFSVQCKREGLDPPFTQGAFLRREQAPALQYCHRRVTFAGASIARPPIPSPGGIFRTDAGGTKKTGEEWRNVGCGKKPGKVYLSPDYRPHSSSASLTLGTFPPGEGIRGVALPLSFMKNKKTGSDCSDPAVLFAISRWHASERSTRCRTRDDRTWARREPWPRRRNGRR